MTLQELFGFPKWLTEAEGDILVEALNYNYDTDIDLSEVVVSSKTSVGTDYTSIQLRALVLGVDTRLFGQSGPYYVKKYPFSDYVVGDSERGNPYLLYQGPAPYDVDDIVRTMRDTYGLDFSYSDIAYTSGQKLQPADASTDYVLRLTVNPGSTRYAGQDIPLYAAPIDKVPLVRVINPHRHLPGYENHFFEPDHQPRYDGEIQYFAANVTRASTSIRRLPAGYVFGVMEGEWELGTNYLIPKYPQDGVNNWISSKTPRFQNIYNAKVLYNGLIRVTDVPNANPKLNRVCVIRPDPKYCLGSVGVITMYYRLLGVSLVDATPNNRLSGFRPLDNCPFELLQDLIRNPILDGLTLPE